MEKGQRLSPQAVCRLVEIATDWRNKQGCVYEGRAGILNVEFGCFGNSSPPFKGSYLEMKVENREEYLGSVQLSSTPGSYSYSPEIERYMALYRKIEEEFLEKHIKGIREARENGFAEAERLLEGFDGDIILNN